MTRQTSNQNNDPDYRPPSPICASAGCPYEARVRVIVKPHLWQNLCHACSDARAHKDNLQWCIDRSLDSVEKQRTYCREILTKGIFKSRTFTKIRQAATITREPGQDDEERDLDIWLNSGV